MVAPPEADLSATRPTDEGPSSGSTAWVSPCVPTGGLSDEGVRAATVTATSELVCHGLTFWEFRPLVEQNGRIGWKLLQSMAQMLRDSQAAAQAHAPAVAARSGDS